MRVAGAVPVVAQHKQLLHPHAACLHGIGARAYSVGLVEQLAIDNHLSTSDLNQFARQCNHALHVVFARTGRWLEDHHIAAMGILLGGHAFGIEKGFMTTIHAYTGDQPTLDTMHKDLYRARAAAMSMIPTSTGAAKAVGLVLPELKGKLDGVSIRVPTPNVSVIDFKFVAKKTVTVDEVNAVLVAAADGPLKGILAYTNEPLVSVDLNHNPASSTFALDQTKVIEGNLVRVMSWYDNEWGYSNRVVDLITLLMSIDK